MKSIRPLAALLGAMLVASCDVGQKTAQTIAGPTAGSAVKFFNFGVVDSTVNFYADTLKMSAASTTTCSSSVNGSTSDTTCLTTGKESSTTGTAYGVAAIGGGLYASIAPGTHTLMAKIVSPSALGGTTIASTSASFADGQFYSYYLSGIYNSASRTVDAFIVPDALPAIDFTTAYVRFVNAISNSQPMTLYAKSETTGIEVPIGSTVAYKGASAFVALPNDIYDLSARVAGSSTNVIARTAVSFSASRVYTISAYGDITSTAAKGKPALDNTANR